MDTELQYKPLNSFGDLATVWGVSAKTVYRWMKRWGKKFRLKVKRPSARIILIEADEAKRFWKLIEGIWDEGTTIRRERVPVTATPRQKRR